MYWGKREWTYTLALHCAHLHSRSYYYSLSSSRRAPLPLAMRGRRALVDDLSLENSDSEEPPASPTPSSGLPGTPTPSSEHSLDPGPPPYSVNNTEWRTHGLKHDVHTCAHTQTHLPLTASTTQGWRSDIHTIHHTVLYTRKQSHLGCKSGTITIKQPHWRTEKKV